MSLKTWWEDKTCKFRRTFSTPDLGKEPYQGPTVRPSDDLYLSAREMRKLYRRYETIFSQALVSLSAVTMYYHPPNVENCWIYQLSGVPVVVWLPLEGRVVFYIADMESSDPLWHNEIVNHNQLIKETSLFFTMKMAGVNGRERVGLRYDCVQPADVMFNVVAGMVDKALTLKGRRWFRPRPRANPADPLLGPGLSYDTSISRLDMYHSMRDLDTEQSSTQS